MMSSQLFKHQRSTFARLILGVTCQDSEFNQAEFSSIAPNVVSWQLDFVGVRYFPRQWLLKDRSQLLFHMTKNTKY